MPARAPFPTLPMPRGVLHASMISASPMVFSLWLLLQAFEDDRVWESIRPAGNLFHDLVGPVLEHDELRLKSRESSPSPRLRGEGWGEGAFQQVLTRRNAPSPGLLRNPTSPRKRGEVNEG